MRAAAETCYADVPQRSLACRPLVRCTAGRSRGGAEGHTPTEGGTQMRRRGLLAVPALLASMAFAPAAQADDALKMYRVTVDEQGIGTLAELGVDIGHTGYDRSKRIAQTIFVDLIDQQAREARAEGL